MIFFTNLQSKTGWFIKSLFSQISIAPISFSRLSQVPVISRETHMKFNSLQKIRNHLETRAMYVESRFFAFSYQVDENQAGADLGFSRGGGGGFSKNFPKF